jgi:TDG/mug DNA glycosylase family protein
MVRIVGFAPLARPDARVLILGSMPSSESIARQRYYAHPRNAFWPILCQLLTIDTDDYEQRTRAVMARGIAVWDVLQACFRPGSLDADIDDRTAVTNDFTVFFEKHPRIRHIFFNGAKAESVYRRKVLPGLAEPAASIALLRLPSTSPAHAGMTLQQKAEAWRVVVDSGLE